MKLEKVLLILIVLMHFTTLVNITLLNADWNGIVLFLSTLLFLAALFFYFAGRNTGRRRSRF